MLVTGPTGSGKSTTLYGALAVVNDGETSILTIEDPVESQIAGIKQMQVSAKAGVTFATGLRSMLRADPDVIMVGEIRDRETAEIAIQAALTGHLVLSTLHTRDAASAHHPADRHGDRAVHGRGGDRLRRRPAPRAAALRSLQAPRRAARRRARGRQRLWGAELYEPVGCIRCGDTGYQGRLGLYEVMPLNDEIRALVLERRSVSEIAAAGASSRHAHDARGRDRKVRQGLTSLAEVARVTSER